MLETFIRVIPLGIGAAMTPSLLGLQVLATVGPAWSRRAIMVIAGAALAFGIACIVLFLGFAQLPHRDPKGPNIVQGVLYLLATVALVVVVAWLFRPHQSLAERSAAGLRHRLEHAHAVTFFGIAFLLSIKDVSSFALLVPGLHDIATSGISPFGQAAAVAFMFGLALSPTLIPAAWRLFRGPRAERSLNRLYDWTMRHQFAIIGFIACVFAVYCLVMGLGHEGLGVAPW